MQHAQSLLGAKDAANDVPTLQQAGEVQQEVVTQLDKLIAELSKQCKSCNGQSAGGPPKPSQASQSKPGKPGAAAGSGQTAARDSTDRLDSSTAKPVDKGDIEAVVKDLWGHLPERSREQMMQSFSEEFLPKYELEIEQYYRRLSEENDRKIALLGGSNGRLRFSLVHQNHSDPVAQEDGLPMIKLQFFGARR